MLPVVEGGIANEELARVGYFSPTLNMASDFKHNFLLPFGNMNLLKNILLKPGYSTNNVHAIQYFSFYCLF